MSDPTLFGGAPANAQVHDIPLPERRAAASPSVLRITNSAGSALNRACLEPHRWGNLYTASGGNPSGFRPTGGVFSPLVNTNRSQPIVVRWARTPFPLQPDALAASPSLTPGWFDFG